MKSKKSRSKKIADLDDSMTVPPEGVLADQTACQFNLPPHAIARPGNKFCPDWNLDLNDRAGFDDPFCEPVVGGVLPRDAQATSFLSDNELGKQACQSFSSASHSTFCSYLIQSNKFLLKF